LRHGIDKKTKQSAFHALKSQKESALFFYIFLTSFRKKGK